MKTGCGGKRTLPLPIGWSVKEDQAIGVTYFDDMGCFVVQHPYDTDAALIMAVTIYRNEIRMRNHNAMNEKRE